MATHDPIVHQLMLSRLSPSVDAGVYARIVQASRQHNPGLGLSGALVFDGEHFCHLLEGPMLGVAQVFGRIRTDPRHADLSVLHAGTGRSGHGLEGWYSGYCEPAELDQFHAALAGPRAVDRFLSLLQHCDLAL